MTRGEWSGLRQPLGERDGLQGNELATGTPSTCHPSPKRHRRWRVVGKSLDKSPRLLYSHLHPVQTWTSIRREDGSMFKTDVKGVFEIDVDPFLPANQFQPIDRRRPPCKSSLIGVEAQRLAYGPRFSRLYDIASSLSCCVVTFYTAVISQCLILANYTIRLNVGYSILKCKGL